MNITNLISKGKKALSNVFANAQADARNFAGIQDNYGPAVTSGYAMSGGTSNPARSINSFLKAKNLPGQVITNSIAARREQSPQYQTNVQISRGGQRISPQQQAQTAEAGMAPVVGMSAPKSVPKIDPQTQKEMIGFIDYVRRRSPVNVQTEYEAARLAEHYGLKMPKTRAGLANVFDKTIQYSKRYR